MERKYIGIKKIIGNKYKAGIYVYSNNSAVHLMDVNNRVVGHLKIGDKIDLFSIVLTEMINKGLNDDILSIEKVFDIVMDSKSRDLENSINELFHKVIFLYTKPNVDIKEVLSIADLVMNRLCEYSDNDEFVKEELSNRLHYV